MSATLRLDDLSVGWEGHPTLEHVDLEVPAGSTLALLGRSGAGKSTLLRTIAGLLPPLSGAVLLDGVDQRDVPAHRRKIGMVFQGHALFPHATVARNVAFGPRLAGTTTPAARSIAQEWLRRVDLDGYADRDISTLSGGERQRVAIARTMAAEPMVVLLDEPLGALDAGLRAGILADLRGLFDDVGMTAVHVTHDPTEAATLADTIAVLDNGRVAQVGTPVDTWERPASADVARLVGHPNVLDGLLLGIRPDPARPVAVVPPAAVHVVGDGDPDASVDGVVQVIAPGATWTATVRLPSGADLVVRVDADHSLRPRSMVNLRVDRSRIQWVPRHSTEQGRG